MYFLKYPIKEISKKTGVPVCTITGWAYRERWNEIRDSTVTDIHAEAQSVIESALHGTCNALRVASRVLQRVEATLDASETSDAREGPKNASDEAQALSALASAVKDAADVLLRVFGK